MKKPAIHRYLFIIILCAGFLSCEKWVDVDADPNAISDGPEITENIMLIGVEAEWVETANGRLDTWGGGFTTWTSWYGKYGTQPENMNIGVDFGNEVWDSYSGSLKHAVELYDKASTNGNVYYQGIAGVIAAWHWFYIADVYDQAPLEDAMMGLEVLHPTLASQEEIYAHANGLLDEAITLFQSSNGGERVPGSDDYMLGGDITKWSKLAYSLKARQAMRLLYAPGKTKTAQADLVLSYLENGMTSNDDIVVWKHLEELANASRVHTYMNRAYTGGLGLTPGNFLVDMMNSYNDPRRYIMFTFSEEDPTGFVGISAGAVLGPGQTPSHYKFTFLDMSYPDFIMTYAETQFLKAEAYAIKGDWVLAEAAMKEGSRADMEYIGVQEAEIVAYNSQVSLTMPN